jgi:hypothetical protein
VGRGSRRCRCPACTRRTRTQPRGPGRSVAAQSHRLHRQSPMLRSRPQRSQPVVKSSSKSLQVLDSGDVGCEEWVGGRVGLAWLSLAQPNRARGTLIPESIHAENTASRVARTRSLGFSRSGHAHPPSAGIPACTSKRGRRSRPPPTRPIDGHGRTAGSPSRLIGVVRCASAMFTAVAGTGADRRLSARLTPGIASWRTSFGRVARQRDGTTPAPV